MPAAQQPSMMRKQILMPPMMAERVQKIAKNRGVSFGEVVRDAVDAFDETISQEDAALLDAMADNLISTTNDTIERIDELMKRMDETHAMVMEATHGDRG
jgi:predicted DNA-binding protein